MYVQGVSTRKVAEITQQLCGLDVSSAQVSRAAEQLDAELQAWRNRPLGKTPYLVLDARYEKVRHGGSVRDCAVLIAIGVTDNGRRNILGVSVSLSEAEVHWRNFFKSLMDRGLHGIQLITSDDLDVTQLLHSENDHRFQTDGLTIKISFGSQASTFGDYPCSPDGWNGRC